MVAVWLRAADLFVLPTAREGCCNAILEALASGLPVVTTPVGDNARFVVDGTNGLIVPVDDVAGFAEAMVRGLAQLAWDPLQISRNLQVGQWDSVARQVVTFFEEQLQRAPRRQGQRAAGQLPIKRWS
jgi:glycosyltransferase involved in cell wall biosynthesis